jgi:hypothetical protein
MVPCKIDFASRIDTMSWLWIGLVLAMPSATNPALYAEVPQIVTFTTQEDHANMLRQLGITRLRPGPSGNESAPNHANYDESLANPFPELPPLLIRKSGEPVRTADEWNAHRRPEIVEDFEREVVGRLPPGIPGVKWRVVETTEIELSGTPVIEKKLEGVVDNSACPAIEVRIAMTVGTPKNVTERVPVLMMYGGFGFGAGRGGPPAGAPRGASGGAGGGAGGAGGASRGAPPGGSRTKSLIDAGWGYATISPNSIQADNGAGLTRGIIGLTNRGQPRKPDDWGALRAWAWGAARGLDYLETDPAVDPKRVGIEGVSRYGKAALVAMAFESRFAIALVGSSGEGGAKLHRRNFGEAVENLTGSGEYHWMAGNFLKYGAEESSLGRKNAGDIPVDAHQLIALCAPRFVFISCGVPEKGDAKWLDQQGSFMATVAAGPAYRLLGAKDLGTSDDYLREKMPPVNQGLLDGQLAWRQHDGGHTDGPNIPHFLTWASRQLK